MPHPIPITDRVLAQLIALWREPGRNLDGVTVEMVAEATPAALEELAVYRRLLGHQFAIDMIEAALEAGPNIVRFPANRGHRGARVIDLARPVPEGAA